MQEYFSTHSANCQLTFSVVPTPHPPPPPSRTDKFYRHMYSSSCINLGILLFEILHWQISKMSSFYVPANHHAGVMKNECSWLSRCYREHLSPCALSLTALGSSSVQFPSWREGVVSRSVSRIRMTVGYLSRADSSSQCCPGSVLRRILRAGLGSAEESAGWIHDHCHR